MTGAYPLISLILNFLRITKAMKSVTASFTDEVLHSSDASDQIRSGKAGTTTARQVA